MYNFLIGHITIGDFLNVFNFVMMVVIPTTLMFTMLFYYVLFVVIYTVIKSPFKFLLNILNKKEIFYGIKK